MKVRLWCINVILLFCLPLCKCLPTGRKSNGKCLQQEVEIPRHFYVDEHDLPFLIEVSDRLTHQLVSHIFKILLTEVIGYENVTFVPSGVHREYIGENATRTLQKISNCDTPQICRKIGVRGPEVMLSLEVWLVPGFNMEGWTSTGNLEDCGPLGPIGRSGWFVSDHSVQEIWGKYKSVVDHWRALLNPEVAALFDLTGAENNLGLFTFDSNNNMSYCTFDECDEDGIYRPVQCQNNTCATLLVDYAEPTFHLLKTEITRLGLFVNVAWVGGNLEKLVNDRILKTLHTIFYHKKPSLLVSLRNYTHMSFPHCEDSSAPACEFQVYQLEKIAWSKIKTNAQHAFHLLRAMSFTQRGYTDLLDSYSRNTLRDFTAYDVACLWVQENGFVWHKWIPGDLNERTPLHIGGIFPLSGYYYKHSGVITAAQMAIKAVNQNFQVLPNYRLVLLEQDGHCEADEVMKSFVNYVTNSTYHTMVGILGPACTDTVEPIAGLAKHFNTLIISYSAEGSLFNNRDKYPYFFRTIPENSQFRFVYLKLFQQLKWNRVAALTEDGQKFPEYISLLQDLFQHHGMTFIASRIPRERTSKDMKPYLKWLKDNGARIIIGDFSDLNARAVMCTAYKMDMTASHGYQWFLPLWFTTGWYDTDHYNSIAKLPQEVVPCKTDEMIEAIDGHLSLTRRFYAHKDRPMQEERTVGEWMDDYKNKTEKEGRNVSAYGGYTYDAVWAYAIALDQLFRENNSHVATLHTNKTSRRLVELLNNTRFNGVSGRVESITTGRLSEVIICQWLEGLIKEVGTYIPSAQEDGSLELNESHIVWRTANGLKPSDGTMSIDSCPPFFEVVKNALGVSCPVATVMVNVVPITIFIMIGVSAFFYFKRRYEKKMRLTEDRMRELGLLTDSVVALDEFEMRRDYIVINRKLGEGAFGTVYGGEAFVQNKGWIAVAVKTLKVGAKPDEKLDFLSEAEVMKKFDHMNIVHLVGVCTMGEPVYTVMEFMLYGDLKTYLLGRRNLVNEPDRADNEEVSNRRLTNMALDIARGLSYLADLKYVHRDLACRNCLVNANRSVKIADFGMCRPMYDSDYYRFNKRGMLPVRWMAPESLTDGLFTCMSDVWSYGVVLYEIITFGSFPYQGLSNSQVLEHVKNFNTLNVPNGSSPELSDLLKKCWSKVPGDRPQAAEVVELLVSLPELITPSLDVPTASVELEDTNSMEFTIHDRSRNHSVTSLWRSQRHLSADLVGNGKAENKQPSSSSTKDSNSSTDQRLYTTNKHAAGRKSVPKDQKCANNVTIIVTKL